MKVTPWEYTSLHSPPLFSFFFSSFFRRLSRVLFTWLFASSIQRLTFPVHSVSHWTDCTIIEVIQSELSSKWFTQVSVMQSRLHYLLSKRFTVNCHLSDSQWIVIYVIHSELSSKWLTAQCHVEQTVLLSKWFTVNCHLADSQRLSVSRCVDCTIYYLSDSQ